MKKLGPVTIRSSDFLLILIKWLLLTNNFDNLLLQFPLAPRGGGCGVDYSTIRNILTIRILPSALTNLFISVSLKGTMKIQPLTIIAVIFLLTGINSSQQSKEK